ncbi:hypothetical protein [Hymenobacter glacieicola]|uniref:HTH HARE-type domain-containing protein n=1 Tax=Hymenobacter glacieicola TaxID=1562124 RepID=A0ABQ1X8J5_9BACT|nr:hypothetical protein [Hymenobacter glacieicola]GGG61262.1 hypothetical protein GCM10011378_41600 [Hymenobacter glacieicola]
MAKRIFSIVSVIRTLLDEQGAYASTPRIAEMLGMASKQLQTHYLGGTGLWRPRPGVDLNTECRLALAPFLRDLFYEKEQAGVTEPTNLLEATGDFNLPLRFRYSTSAEVEGAVAPVEWLDEHAKTHRLNCPIKGPTPDRPLISQRTAVAGLRRCRLHPASCPNLTLQYYELVPEPVYAESYASGNPEYDDAASVDTGWGEEHEPELITRTLRLLGVSLRDGMMQQAANLLTQENN